MHLFLLFPSEASPLHAKGALTIALELIVLIIHRITCSYQWVMKLEAIRDGRKGVCTFNSLKDEHE